MNNNVLDMYPSSRAFKWHTWQFWIPDQRHFYCSYILWPKTHVCTRKMTRVPNQDPFRSTRHGFWYTDFCDQRYAGRWPESKIKVHFALWGMVSEIQTIWRCLWLTDGVESLYNSGESLELIRHGVFKISTRNVPNEHDEATDISSSC